jgi:hypothetical protein
MSGTNWLNRSGFVGGSDPSPTTPANALPREGLNLLPASASHEMLPALIAQPRSYAAELPGGGAREACTAKNQPICRYSGHAGMWFNRVPFRQPYQELGVVGQMRPSTAHGLAHEDATVDLLPFVDHPHEDGLRLTAVRESSLISRCLGEGAADCVFGLLGVPADACLAVDDHVLPDADHADREELPDRRHAWHQPSVE